MGKYGKKNKVNLDLSHYNICVLGESGIGKTTLMKETCETLYGEDGYMIFNCGKEDGVDCLADASYENIEDYKKFDAVTKDIIKNKETDYPDLKVVIIDTLDQLFEQVEPEVVRQWNSENLGKKDFIPAKTLNQSWGGFGRGEDKVIQVILDRMWELKKVGVAFWACGHTKTREILDPLTSTTYTSLTTNMMQKYFNGIKTKFHIVGMACIDREIIKESTGRQNVVTKKDITKNKVVSESRKIIFRDDNYGVDSKSRFADIVAEIPLDKDAFIEALTNAVKAAASKSKVNSSSTVAIKSDDNPPIPEPKMEHKTEPITEAIIDDDIDNDIDDTSLDLDIPDDYKSDDIEYPSNLTEVIRQQFKECLDKTIKGNVKTIINQYGKLNDVSDDGLKQIYRVLNGLDGE